MRNIGNLEVSGSLNISGSAIIVGIVSASSFIGDGSGLVGVTSYTNTDTLNYINTLGVVSGSSQINYNNILNVPSGIVSGSQQLATEISGAFTSVSASIALDIANISTDFQDITNKPTLVSGSSQIIYNQISSIPSGIVSSSAQLANITIPGNLTITDRLTAQEFHTEFVSASIIYESGSTKFGDSSDDIHSFTGSLNLLGTLSATTIQNVVSSSSQVSFTGITDKPTLVSGSAQISSLGFTTCVGDITGVTAGTGLSGGGTSGGVTLSVNADQRGNVTLIGADTNDYIQVAATVIDFRLDGNLDMRLENDGDLHVDGNVIAYSTTTSDERLKDNIETLNNSLDKLKKLRGVSYIWKKGGREGQKDIGVIAQEVEEIFPELVREVKLPTMDIKDNTKYKTVDYDKLSPILIEAIKELSNKLEYLENKINNNGITK